MARDSYRRPRDYDRSPERGYYDDYSRYARREQDYYRPRSRSPPRGPRDSGFVFRGAAANDRQPQHDFSFRSHGASNPNFPPESSYDRRDPPPRRLPPGRGRYQSPRYTDRRHGKAAHQRAILRSDRERTPEQLEGMSLDAQLRFENIDRAFKQSQKETALKRQADQEQVAADDKPQWSNPDPYTALPPPGAVSGAKVDILAVIRKSKAEVQKSQTAQTAVKNNVDFISFDDEESMPPDKKTQLDRNGEKTINIKLKPSSQTQAPQPAKTIKRVFDKIDDDSVVDDVPPRSELKSLPLKKLRAAQAAPPSRNSSSSPETNLRSPSTHFYSHNKIIDEPVMLELWQGDSSTPWYRDDKRSRQLPSEAEISMKLHNEIVLFQRKWQPTQEEGEVRLALIQRVQQTINSSSVVSRTKAEVHAFGSFASGLYLPTSDMDLVVLSQEFITGGDPAICQSATKLRELRQHIERSGIAMSGSLTLIAHARVPLIKYVDRLTGFRVDLSFENASGLQAIRLFRKWNDRHPALPALVMLIKQLVAMYGQNEVHTGGIGGYSIICLVVTLLEQNASIHPTDQAGDEHNYGQLLVKFLELFGSRFNIRNTGIRMEPSEFFSKKTYVGQAHKTDRLTIIDPNNAANDIAGGTRNINDVLDLFYNAGVKLNMRLEELARGKHVNKSILGAVWAADYSSFEYQRAKIHRVHQQSGPHRSQPRAATMPDLQLMVATSLRLAALPKTVPKRSHPGGNNHPRKRQRYD